MNIKRMFVSAFVRRVVYVIVTALIGMVSCVVQEASAQECSQSYTVASSACADQGLAAEAAAVSAQAYVAWSGTANDVACYHALTATSVQYSIRLGGSCTGSINRYFTRTFPAAATCSSRPNGDSGWYRVGSGTTCDAGCSYGGGTSSSSYTLDGVTFLKTTGRSPTGSICDYSSESDQEVEGEQCRTTGTLTQCIREDGKHCATASTGKRFCWQPDEAGTKGEGNEGATKTPNAEIPKPPNKPPPNGGEWTQGPSGPISTSTNGGPTNNYTITNWNSNYGNQGTGGGSTNPDGSENPGNGSGDGDGEGDGDDDGPGPPTNETIGDLYEPTDDTAESLMQAFFNAAGDTQLLQSVNTFFGNCGYGGACPSMQYENEYFGRLSFSQLCDGTMDGIFTFAGFCVLAVAAFGAWRIAVY